MLVNDLHKLDDLNFTHLIGNKLYGYYSHNSQYRGIVWDMLEGVGNWTPKVESFEVKGIHDGSSFQDWTISEQSIIKAVVLGRLTKTELVQGLHLRGYRGFQAIKDFIGGYRVYYQDSEIEWSAFLLMNRDKLQVKNTIKMPTEEEWAELESLLQLEG